MKTVMKVVVNIFAWVMLIFALLVTIIVFSSGRNNNVANVFGYIPLTVESDSMAPTFKKGDLIICKETDDIYDLSDYIKQIFHICIKRTTKKCIQPHNRGIKMYFNSNFFSYD